MVQEQVDQQQPLFQNGQTNADIFFFFEEEVAAKQELCSFRKYPLLFSDSPETRWKPCSVFNTPKALLLTLLLAVSATAAAALLCCTASLLRAAHPTQHTVLVSTASFTENPDHTTGRIIVNNPKLDRFVCF